MRGLKHKRSKEISPQDRERSSEKNTFDSDDVEDDVQCPPHTTERKLLARIDLHIIPVLSILYLLAFLDRVNISNAVVFKLRQDLKITSGVKYNTALVIFFVPYVLFEIPANILMKRFKPHIWLSTCMVLFGFATVMQGIVKNYSGLLATRFFLGLFECNMFPGAFYIIGMWYKRAEAQKRFSFFFGSTVLAGAFGGLLASAIGKMQGLRGYNGWRWIFILEGTLTCVVGFIFFFLLPGFPEEAKWVTEEERSFIKARLHREQGHSAAESSITFGDVVNVFKDYKIFIGGLMYFGLIVPAYGYAYFSPSIIQTYGYSPIQTQLHSVPTWAVSFTFIMIIAYLSDRTRHRFLFTIFPICIAIAGFAILLTVHDNLHLQYAALFLSNMGTYAAMPVVICWFTQNLGGHKRRSVGSAWQIGFGNIGGIIAVYAFLQKDAPRYKPGYSICIAFHCLSALCCCVYALACWSQNRDKRRMTVDVGLTEYEKTQSGDLNPEYRYQL